MLDVRLLQSFREVALRGSFSVAAEELGFTQPAISQHVARLERHLGVKLLERDGRGVTLTRAGDALLGEIDGVLGAVRRAENAARTAGGAASSRVRVAAFPTAASGLLPGAARALRAAVGDAAHLDLAVLEPEAAMRAVARGNADVGLVIASALDPVEAPDGIELVAVHEDPMMIALPAEHPLATQRAIALEDLAKEQWLLTFLGGTCADSNIVRSACRDAGFTPDVRLESEDYNALQGMAAAGLGVALVPMLATIGAHPDVVIRPLRGRPPTRDVLAAIRKGPPEPLVDATIEALRESGRRLAGRGLSLAA